MAEEQTADEEFASRMSDAAASECYLTVEAVEGHFRGFQVVHVKRTGPYYETRFVMRSFIGPAHDDQSQDRYEQRANEYVYVAAQVFGLEIRS